MDKQRTYARPAFKNTLYGYNYCVPASIQKILRNPSFPFICVLAIYGVLLLPTVSRQGISWDEQTDIWVARAYLKQPDGWLVGSDIDPSQTRLPVFTVALLYTLFNNSGLILARYTSCIIGALTLAAVYIFCRRRYDNSRGILACGLLATSPFYLSFARVAFTETDIYLACTLAWLLVSVDRLQDQPSIRRAAIVGIMAGLAISAKFTALAVLPALWYAIWQTKKRGQGKELHPENIFIFSFWIVAVFVYLLVGWYIPKTLTPDTYQGTLRLFHYIVIFSGWLLTLVWAQRRHQFTSSWFILGLWITGLAMLTFLVLPPEHLANPGILNSLTNRFQHEMTYRTGFMVEAAALHIFSIFFKSSLVIGAGLLLSLVLTMFQWRNWKIRFPLLVVWLYLGCLVVLPLAQTFYTVPLLPILAIFTADQFLSFASRKRVIASGLAGVAALMLGVDLILCYPDYNLNGYQWLGNRILAGRSSIGYRSVVQTPSDGVEQVMEWLNDHAKPGEIVRAYILPWHIVQAQAPNPVYRLENGLQGRTSTGPDYVVVAINAQIRQSWWIKSSPAEVFIPPYDSAWLELKYSRVFTVRRAFGIEMASVYRKK
jgi:4-amino-4-deoxy-L-arabinose transferase-like glycosyltransferase